MTDSDLPTTIADDDVATAVPDRPPVTLRDLEVLYGELYALATAGGGEYATYLSPDAAADLVGDAQGLLVVRIDLSGEAPRLGDPPVEVTGYASDDVGRVAHAKYQAARGVDHSVTHQTGANNDADSHADHACERLTRWPTEDAVAETAASHEDGWLIEALESVGADEENLAAIRDAVESLIPDERQSLVTVALRLGADHDVQTTEAFDPGVTWHYPGEFEVFQEAMANRQTTKFRSKNRADDAVGDGVCYVRDTAERVYGVVDDPMKAYLSKQVERFPRLDPDESWQTQGLSRDAAVAAQNATPFLEACEYGTAGVSVYYLPYLTGEFDDENARRLYEILAERADESAEDDVPVRVLYETATEKFQIDEDRLRFYVMVVHKYQKDRWRLLAIEPDANARHLRRLAEAHVEVLRGETFTRETLPRLDEFPLIEPGLDPVRAVGVVSGVGYFADTCLGSDADDPSSDDFRYRATAAVLGGDAIDTDRLFGEYVAKIADQFDTDDGRFPSATVAGQYAQLYALADRGLLSDTTFSMSETEQSDETLDRAEKLEQFVSRHEALDWDGEDPSDPAAQRYGVFALGALVGRLSRYQRSNDRSMTAVRNHPVDNLTRHNVKRVATEVVDANVVYSDEEGYTGTMYAELMDQVVDGLLARNPEDWTLSTDDLRYHYALGIAYGLNDRSTSDYDDD